MDYTRKVRKATRLILNHKQRPINSYGVGVGLINLIRDRRLPIIIGDLHGSIENLKAILRHNNNLDKLNSEVIWYF